jgi:hypothetical protein
MKQPRRRKPTIEERLEAIVETLELVAAMQLSNEKEIEQTQKDLSHLTKLSRIVMTSHEARIKSLEGKKR